MMGALRELIRGPALLGRALRAWAVNPRLMAVGLLPGVIAAAILTAVVIGVVAASGPTGEWAADRVAGDGAWDTFVVIAVRIAMVAGSVLLAIVAFTALTMLVGQPFFERIAADVDARLGWSGEPPEEPWWRTTLRGMRDGGLLLLATAATAIGGFVVGLVPLVGTVTSAVAGALIGGWFLALELTAYPFARRGVLLLRERRRILGARRYLAAGYGASVGLVCLLPLGAIAIMPVAVVGGALLAREALGEATERPQAG